MYVPEEIYSKTGEPSEDEQDMLDLALGVIEGSSRLGCQVKVTAEMEGMEVTLPKSVINQLG